MAPKRAGEGLKDPKPKAAKSAASPTKAKEAEKDPDPKEVPLAKDPADPVAMPLPSSPTLRPELPADDSLDSAIPIVTRIIAWGKPLLLKAIEDRGLGKGAGCSLEDILPLEWDSKSKQAATYKEMWNTQHAHESLRLRGIYEAGASMFWLEAMPSTKSTFLTWSNVVAASALLRETVLPSGSCRILWPCVLHAAVQLGNMSVHEYPQVLQLLHGHELIFAFWLAIYKALFSRDEKTLSMLIETALCVTIQVRACETPEERTVAGIEAASIVHELKVLNQPFHVFAFRVSGLIESLPKDSRSSQKKILQGLNKAFGDRLRFEGKALNATMLSAIVALTKIMPQEEAAAKYLALIFQWYGGTVNVYSRLYKIVSTVNGYYKDQSADTETVCQAGADQNFIAQRL